MFARLKDRRRVVTRYDRCADLFLSACALAAVVMFWLWNWISNLSVKVSDPANPVGSLSGGNQQRIVLAKWLATKPRLLNLDSPTVGVDIGARDGIYAIVRRLAEEGLGVIMISDEIPEVYYHAHRVLVMRGGRISGDYRPSHMTEAALQDAVDA